MSPRFFIRDDDVWTLDPAFRFFFDAAMERKVPVVYAVIPGKMDAGIVRFLRRAKEETPQLLDIAQHGWVHANHSSQTGVKYEFGLSRPFNAQNEDIRRGLKKMRRAFGELFTPAFVPPYHGYDARTLQVLGKEGFQILSAGARQPKVKGNFINLPAGISFSQYKKGLPKVQRARDVIAALEVSTQHRPLSGVLTHHADFSTMAFRRELTRFFDYAATMEAGNGCQALLFSQLPLH